MNLDFFFANLADNSCQVDGLQPFTQYYWRVCSSNVAGCSNFSQIRRFTTLSVADDDVTAPVVENKLGQNYPNPFNPSTTIALSVKDPTAELSVQIFDIKGRLVRDLYGGLAGKNSLMLVWDGKDNHGTPCGSGIYHYRMRSGSYVETRKMIILK